MLDQLKGKKHFDVKQHRRVKPSGADAGEEMEVITKYYKLYLARGELYIEGKEPKFKEVAGETGSFWSFRTPFGMDISLHDLSPPEGGEPIRGIIHVNVKIVAWANGETLEYLYIKVLPLQPEEEPSDLIVVKRERDTLNEELPRYTSRWGPVANKAMALLFSIPALEATG